MNFHHSLTAQSKSFEISIVDGKEYYKWTVEQGNTIYSISKTFDVSVDDIFKNNPGSERGIEINDELLIPVIRKSISHKVEANQTLYSIARFYAVKIESILDQNPDAKSGIQIGETLHIPNGISPISKEKITVENNNAESEFQNYKINDSILKYKVNKGETIYSLSKRYKIKYSDIMKINKLYNPTLSEGQVILIPLRGNDPENSNFDILGNNIPSDSTQIWSLKDKDNYHIVFCLPIGLDSSSKKSLQYGLMSADFLMGSSLALDTLEKLGLNATVEYLDYLNSKIPLMKQLSSIQSNEIDLLFAPLDTNYYSELKEWSKINQTMVIYPQYVDYGILFNNPYATTYIPFKEQQIEVLAKYCAETGRKTILIESDSLKNDYLNRIFSQTFRKNQSSNNFTLINANTNNYKKFKKSTDTVSYVFLCQNEKMVEEFLSKNFSMDEKNQKSKKEENHDLLDFKIFGLEEWLQFENIAQNVKNKYTFQFVGKSDFNYQDDGIKSLNQLYRNTYQCDLSSFACFGFDITYNILSSMILKNKISPGRMNDLIINQRFPGHGYENAFNYILEFKNFKTTRIRE